MLVVQCSGYGASNGFGARKIKEVGFFQHSVNNNTPVCMLVHI